MYLFSICVDYLVEMSEQSDEPDDPENPAEQTTAKRLADHDLSRRKILLTGGVGAAAGLSGCSGLGGGETPTPRVIEKTVIEERTVEKTVKVTPEPEPESYVVTSHVFVTGDVEGFEHTHFAASCAPQYQFVPGQTIGFRVGIWDPDTGEQLTNEDLESVTITVEGPTDFGPLECDWNGDDEEHPADQWSVSLRDTDNAPAGQYKWTVSVTDSDAEFRSVGIWENTFTMLESGSVPTVTPTPTPSS